jgi:hypothetical protein
MINLKKINDKKKLQELREIQKEEISKKDVEKPN